MRRFSADAFIGERKVVLSILSLKLVLYQAINFIVLMVILSFLFNKFIRPFMHKRSEEIKKSFEEIEKQKREMESLKRSYTDQIKDIREKAKLEIEKAVEEGGRMREEHRCPGAQRIRSAYRTGKNRN